MNTLLTHRDKKKLFSYLPDVWFLAILLLGWGGAHEHYVVRCVAHRRNRVGRIPFIGYRNFS